MKRWRRNDLLLVFLVAGLAAAVWLFRQAGRDAGNAHVIVKVDGRTEGIYDLNEDQTISVNHGSNTLVIRDGQADMTDADCPDKLCVKHRPIRYRHENIICLPNRIVVEVESDSDAQLDAVTN